MTYKKERRIERGRLQSPYIESGTAQFLISQIQLFSVLKNNYMVARRHHFSNKKENKGKQNLWQI